MAPIDSPKPVLCLASASPRRRELLAQIDVPHVIAVADIDEAILPGEAPGNYVLRLAREKALAVWRAGQQQLPVLAADTTVVVRGQVFGKPTDEAQAIYMLGELSGRSHEVLTAVALATADGVTDRLNSSSVRFRKISPEECVAYWKTGEPRDKAGGYAVQGLGAVFIESLSGSYSGVMGLPLFETGELLKAAGIAYWNGAGRGGERA
jgi:septum formation protein